MDWFSGVTFGTFNFYFVWKWLGPNKSGPHKSIIEYDPLADDPPDVFGSETWVELIFSGT